MSQEEFNMKADRIVLVVLGLLAIGGFVWLGVWIWGQTPSVPPAPPSDMQIVSGSRKDLVVVTHDNKRKMTCYVDTMHGGIWCTEDIVIQDALGMMAYRDAWLP